MNNLERFKRALDWQPIDRLLTYDYLDNRQLLIDYGGYDASRSYSFEELIEVNAVNLEKHWGECNPFRLRSRQPLDGRQSGELDSVLWG